MVQTVSYGQWSAWEQRLVSHVWGHILSLVSRRETSSNLQILYSYQGELSVQIVTLPYLCLSSETFIGYREEKKAGGNSGKR